MKKEEAMCSRGRDWRDATLCQGIRTAVRNGKRQGTHFPLKPMEGTWSCLQLECGSVRITVDLWLPELWEIHFFVFKTNQFAVICYSSHRELVQRLRE